MIVDPKIGLASSMGSGGSRRKERRRLSEVGEVAVRVFDETSRTGVVHPNVLSLANWRSAVRSLVSGLQG